MITNLAHVCIGCTDLADVERLYCQALGFRKRFEFLKAGRVIGFYLQVSATSYLEFFQAAEVPPAGSPIRHICLETEDIDAVAERLKQHGYEVTPKKLGADQSWQIWIRNAPDGVAIEFHQYTAPSSQRTGRPCEVNW